jgi:hypothetical protein
LEEAHELVALIPRSGLILTLIGVGCIVLGFLPDFVPWIFSSFIQPNLTPRDTDWFIIPPEAVLPIYFTIAGIIMTGLGSWLTVREFGRYRKTNETNA